MSELLDHHPLQNVAPEAAAGVWLLCRRARIALSDQWSRFEDDRVFPVVVVIIGLLPCMLLAFALFWK